MQAGNGARLNHNPPRLQSFFSVKTESSANPRADRQIRRASPAVFRRLFPRLGSFRVDFSKPWKKSGEIFQCLEKRRIPASNVWTSQRACRADVIATWPSAATGQKAAAGRQRSTQSRKGKTKGAKPDKEGSSHILPLSSAQFRSCFPDFLIQHPLSKARKIYGMRKAGRQGKNIEHRTSLHRASGWQASNIEHRRPERAVSKSCEQNHDTGGWQHPS